MAKSLLTLCAFFFSSSLLADNIQDAVDDICNCYKEPYALVDKSVAAIQQAQASGDYAKMAELQGEMMGIMNAASNCFETLPTKYPNIDASKELQDKVMSKANEQCPNPARRIIQGN